ncbi:MAG: hypothetical protein P9L96_05620 [Candidatus Gygaella obscura]|nr:hypothetical protein [Candidatus Gygaella obscura]
MKKILNWQLILGLLLIALSAGVYYLHFLIFRDIHHIFIYLVGDIAFVFFEVLLVTLVLHNLLHFREKRSLLKKLNMVIGSFFTELGTDLLKTFSEFDHNSKILAKALIVSDKWLEKDFIRVCRLVKRHTSDLNINKDSLNSLKEFLNRKRDFLLSLLGNSNLLEHESFTDLLWAVFHLTEELSYRVDFKQLPQTDIEHLTNDVKRVYAQLLSEWIMYMAHLKNNYPYLFSLALRTNPFDKEVSVVVA